MKHRAVFAFALVVLAAACEATPTYQDPRPGSYSPATFQVRLNGTVTPLKGAMVARDFFSSAGAPAAFLGRFFIEADAAASSVPVVVLNHDFWKQRLGAEPAAIGQVLEVDGSRATIIAVAPPGFALPEGAQLWMPMRAP